MEILSDKERYLLKKEDGLPFDKRGSEIVEAFKV